jgi:hypothetical protein
MIMSQFSDTSGNLFNQPHLQEEMTLMTVFWRHSAQSLECKPPCQLTLPPIPLDKPATLIYPYITKSVCTKLGGVVYRYGSTISVSPVTIEALELRPTSVQPRRHDRLRPVRLSQWAGTRGSHAMSLWRMRLADKHKTRPVQTAERKGLHGRRARRLANIQLLHV